MKFELPEYPKRLLIGLQEGYCNLKCPMCFVHGSSDSEAIKATRGQMSLEDAVKIFDEVAEAKPTISPFTWYEPFLFKNSMDYIRAIKARGLPININTNGLNVNEELAQFIVESGIESVFVSIDATTPETLLKMRGITALDKIHAAVFRLLDARGELDHPRIGVAFVNDPKSTHEKDEFIRFWLQHVDSVHIIELYNENRSVDAAKIPEERIPCGALYDTMVISNRGNVPICCLDAFNETSMGNVLESGVKNVWLSEELQTIRYYHETNQYDKVPFCLNCQVWADYLVTETVENGVMIRTSPMNTYYNRLDRMYTWKSGGKAVVEKK